MTVKDVLLSVRFAVADTGKTKYSDVSLIDALNRTLGYIYIYLRQQGALNEFWENGKLTAMTDEIPLPDETEPMIVDAVCARLRGDGAGFSIYRDEILNVFKTLAYPVINPELPWKV